MNKKNIIYLYVKLYVLKINIKKIITYFATSYYYRTLNYIKHLISHIYKLSFTTRFTTAFNKA